MRLEMITGAFRGMGLQSNICRVTLFFSVTTMLLRIPTSSSAGTIQGIVSGPRGPVANARVNLLQQGREIHTTLTDPQGQFVLQEVAVGQYQVQVFGFPLLPVVRDATVAAENQTIELSVTLDFLVSRSRSRPSGCRHQWSLPSPAPGS